MYKLFIKPVFDFIISLIGLLLLSPFFILVVVVLSLSYKGNPFFIQRRPGKNGRIFKLIKFKTMNDKKGDDGVLWSDEERLTKVGRILRKTSFDEIPQLINVLKGEMSLVGPRPLLPEYLQLYSREQTRRHEVKPGITGWAQINGRNALSWAEKFDLDIWYVDQITFFLDLKILFITLIKTIKAEGISSGESVTMEKFTGNK
jgi:lipopolysaccharide/colanic/teichoic acid biosynthesis glycosyltransferase